MTKTIDNRVYLNKKLFWFDSTGVTLMSNHVNEFSNIISDLESSEVKVDDKDKTILFLNSLPKSYEHFSTRLLYGKENVTYDGITDAVS